MTDNEIIKALMYCKAGSVCMGCPLFEQKSATCISQLNAAVLDLIKRQQAEIKRLWEDCDYFEEKVKTIRAETITEFAERLMQEMRTYPVYLDDEGGWEDEEDAVRDEDVSRIAKEMTEGDNGA